MILVATTLCACALFSQEPPDTAKTETAPPTTEAPAVTYQPPPFGYRSPQKIKEALAQHASSTDSMFVSHIGETLEGRALLMATFSAPSSSSSTPPPRKTEILIVANLEGDRIAASEVALGIIQHFAADGSPLLENAIVHILPVANPDAMAHALNGELPWRGAPTDNDRDGLLDEDGPHDLDGDGRTLWMRVPKAGGEWLADPTDPRSTRKSDAEKGEAGTFHLLREGSDLDGDRSENEDGPGGVAVEANFAHRWQQYAPEAGSYQLSEPESRALVDFMLQHPAISLVLILDDEDNLSAPPSGKEDSDPHSTDPLEDDALLLKVLGQRFYGEDADEVRTADHQSGNFADWAYYQRGALVLESAVWSPPLDVAGADGEELDEDASEDRKLLAWADTWYLQNAFQVWDSFQHPQLGNVEIGGWMPLVLNNPPSELLEDLTGQCADFLDSLSDDLAKLMWENVTVTPLDNIDVFEVRATLVNRGLLPTTTAMGLINRRPRPIQVHLDIPEGAQLLVGRTRATVNRLEGLGGHEEFTWIARLPDGPSSAQLRAVAESCGEALQTLEVK